MSTELCSRGLKWRKFCAWMCDKDLFTISILLNQSLWKHFNLGLALANLGFQSDV